MNINLIPNVPNDLGIVEEDQGSVAVVPPLFDNFKSLAELVLKEDELKRYQRELSLHGLTSSHRRNGDVMMKDTANNDNNDDDGMEMDVDDPGSRLKRFVGLESFITSSKDQIFSIGVKGLDTDLTERASNVEAMLDTVCEIGGLQQQHHGSIYTWTWIEGLEFDVEMKKMVFVRFYKLKDLVRFVKVYEKLDGGRYGIVAMDANVEQLYRDHLEEEEEEEDINVEKLDELYERCAAGEHVARSGGAEDVYSDYEVDTRELVDVPKELVESVKNDIKEFRLRVVRIERQKREKETVQDKKKARLKLRKLYAEISQSNNGTFGDEEEEEEDVEEDVEGEEEEGYSDEEYEKVQELKRRELEEKEFAAKRKNVRQEDASRKRLMEQLSAVRDPDSVRNSKSVKFYKDFMAQEESNKIDDNLQGFYLNHANYLKFRDSVRRKEMERDQADKSIAEYIDELIMEFIGVGDEALGTYVLELVDAHYPRGKQTVVDQLQETLDEDAALFVDRLWKYIEI